MDFFKLNDYTITEIQWLIDTEQEENIHLDYKASGSIDKSEKKTAEIAKDVSAFANSDGGIIVYGMNEINHKADSFSPIDGNIYTKEWLEQIINSKINRRIDGVKIFPIRIKGNIEQSIYVVKIPRSSDAPHMSFDKRYYKRYNFQSIPIEEYEVRDLFYRHNSSRLSIGSIYISEKKRTGQSVTYSFHTSIVNKSNTIEEQYKLNVYIHSPYLNFISFSWDAIKDTIYHTQYDTGICKLSAKATVPIFGDEKIDLARFDIEIPLYIEDQFLNETSIEYKLLFPTGHSDLCYELKNIERQ